MTVHRVPHPDGPACGLDLGSNTFSFTELRRQGGRIAVVRDASIPVRLSEGLEAGGTLKPAAVMRGLRVIEAYAADHDLKNKPLRAVGTAVFRMASDSERFTEPAREILGVEVEIITGDEEARLVRNGALLDLEHAAPAIIVDVGGQSTELSWQDAGGAVQLVSLPIGVVGLTRRHLPSPVPGRQELEALRKAVREVIGRAVPSDLAGTLVGVAGTATTLGAIELGMKAWQREKVHGMVVPRERLAFWLDTMCSMAPRERTERYGVHAGRADVFPAGLLLLDALLDHLGRASFTISVNGLRVGVALGLLQEGG